ncbi:leucyl-tRNA synthetase [Pseudomassariella vexata]|uniref:leucine--tRNA ligase n=1 Tax=Pseudomassariella vexata TaxID=1141098 RepID=A0A1Y2EKA6_9PEZI|nr:leucyl-tRNA synthetase [Pseudomassariella vexata]ORY71724.1 leucyl-tRNA synthetase [Pseudomassariella vexata]
MLAYTIKGLGGLRSRTRPLYIASIATRRPSRSRCYATQLNLPGIDAKWQRIWKRQALYASMKGEDSGITPKPAKDNFYVLPMFPYPSGNLHLGHLRVYTVADVLARFHRLQGRDVLFPMGWDAFGLPAENAAIERGIDPATWTKQNITRMKQQLDVMNGSFDWSRELATCDPKFYKHTQKIFLLLLKNGLVSQKEAQVNWDPVDKTVLANEQVDAEGRSWRSGAKIELRNLKQWFFHITKLQDALLRELKTLGENSAWPEKVLTMQKNWLGRSQSAYYKFQITSPSGYEATVPIFTTRPETIFAAQFIALSPHSSVVAELAKGDAGLRSFAERAKDLPHTSTEGYEITNVTAVSPLRSVLGAFAVSSAPLRVYVAPYVRGDYETGAIMGVPAHDARDFAFWKQHCPNEPIKYAVSPTEDGSIESLNGQPFLDSGYMTSLVGKYQGLPSEQTAKLAADLIKNKTGMAEAIVKWKLRDWLISRQRYWGTPIPIIHCASCGPVPVPENQLPVTLPKVDHHWADGKSGNPLESATEWINTKCPKCHGPAKRDTDTMDTFVDSSWYYMRFADPENPRQPISRAALESRLPVDLYIGGVEHAILHLLYARFIFKVVTDLLYPKESESVFRASREPFKRLITQGMVHGKTYSDPLTGRFLKPDEVDLSNPSDPKVVATGHSAAISYEKMSKSKHNGVDPTAFIAKYGADATRAHMLFQAPVSDVVNWDEDKIAGITRWLNRLHAFVQTISSMSEGPQRRECRPGEAYFSQPPQGSSIAATQWAADVVVWRTAQETITAVTNAYDKVNSLNTTVSLLMSFTNRVLENPEASNGIKAGAVSILLRMMAPIAPAFTEECWQMLHPTSNSIFDLEDGKAVWPIPDGTMQYLKEAGIKCAVQVNGKLRCVVDIAGRPQGLVEHTTAFKDWLTEQILGSEDARAKLTGDGKDIRNARRVIAVKGGKTVNYVL